MAQELGTNAWRNLRIWAMPLRAELEKLKTGVHSLDVSFTPRCIVRAERLLQWIDRCHDFTDPADCRIAQEVDDLDQIRHDVQRTFTALRALTKARTGFLSVHGDIPFFNAGNYPAYYRQWLRAVKCAETHDWSAFSLQIDALRQARKALLAELSSTSDC
jgi:hypothetical protein